jgi:mono/diheme cytochrome c family protein
MRSSSALLTIALAGFTGIIAGESFVATVHATDSRQRKSSVTRPAAPVVTPVIGPSWLHQLNIPYGGTSMGRATGRYGPGPGESINGLGARTIAVREPVVLTGADLYRLNCQACHTAEGTGSPPEIKSAMDLVQGSSLALVRRHFEQEGRVATGAKVSADAGKARADLFRRIREGGQRMPPHTHLEQADVEAVYAYLTELAHTPDGPPQARRAATWARLGEHVIKGTCHICHDASGMRPTSEAMLQGAIPPLNIIHADNSRTSFISKAKNGAPLVAGRPSFHYRGRMPVFYYLHDEELAAAYDFLTAYPPQAARVTR